MDRPPPVPGAVSGTSVPLPFIPTRFIDTSDLHYYYPFSNTLPEDLLEHVSSDTIDTPSVLQLGCGDMRSCLYTLWKNFDKHCGHGNFEGASFYLNDNSIGVLGRNMLFIYLMLRLAEISRDKTEQEVKTMVCFIWNVWFCHELCCSTDFILIEESLITLAKITESSEAWLEKENPLKHFVTFSEGTGTRERINKTFLKWIVMLKLPEEQVQELQHLRKKAVEPLTKTPLPMRNFGMYVVLGTQDLQSLYGSSRLKTLIMEEFVNYIETGNAHSEALFGIATPTEDDLFLNPTFLERDQLYMVHRASMPYECFFNSWTLSKENIDYPNETLMVDQRAFDKTPLHANSLQQFTLWLISTADILLGLAANNDPSKLPIRFVFDHCDALETAVRLNHAHVTSFDIINTSNLIDHLTTLAVMVYCVPLLKSEHSLLLTSTMSYRSYYCETARNFAEMSLGFRVENLPFLGIRCVGHEGSYSGYGSISPVPVLQAVFERISSTFYPRLLIWKKVVATPFVMQTLGVDTLIAETLFLCIKKSTLSFIMIKGIATVSVVKACSHTAMNALLLFMNQHSRESPVGDHRFWNGLSHRIKTDHALRPFHIHIQCQALLMNIHMHIVVRESNCPICKNTPMEKYFVEYHFRFAPIYCIDTLSQTPSVILCCIHPNDVDPECLTPAQPRSLPHNVHLFDSSRCIKEDGYMLIDILVPVNMFDPHKYTATLFFLNYYNDQEHYLSCPVATTPLCSVCSTISIDGNPPVAEISHYCLQPNPSTPFGHLTLMEYCGSHYTINIALSDRAIALLKKYNVSIKRVSDTDFMVYCDQLSFPLQFSIPIDYDQLTVKYSKRRHLVAINAPCKPFNTYSRDQLPLFHTNPDNIVRYPSMNIITQPLTLAQAAGSQVFLDESKILDECDKDDQSELPPAINAKVFLVSLFQQPLLSYFRLTNQRRKKKRVTYGLIAIHRRSFDVQNITVALDLSFYIRADGIDSNTDPGYRYWQAMKDRSKQVKTDDEVIPVNGDQLSVIEDVLMVFHKRTRISKNTAVHSSNEFKMEECFRRAVVYHLSTTTTYDTKPHPQPTLNAKATIRQLLDTRKHICSFCRSEVRNVRKCSRCLEAVYCGKECQVQDWKMHKAVCMQKNETTPTTVVPSDQSRCHNCGDMSDDLRKCTRCKKAVYCTKTCQIEHWNKHRLVCH